MGGYCCTSNFILGLSYSYRFAFTSQCSMFLPLFTPLQLSLHTDPLPRCPGILVNVLVSSLSQSLPCCVFPFTLKNNDSGLLLISYSPEIAFFFFSLSCVFVSVGVCFPFLSERFGSRLGGSILSLHFSLKSC